MSSIGLVVVVLLGYWTWTYFSKSSTSPTYILARAEKTTVIASVSGSGQVSASNQLDLKPRASGDVVSIAVTNGQEVKAGALIVALDARDAQKTVRDAEVNLQSAKIALEKLQKPADALTTIQAENALVAARESKSKAESDLEKAYEDVFNTISSTFLDLPPIMTGLENILFSTALNPQKTSDNISFLTDAVKSYDEKVLIYRDTASTNYQKARSAYQKNFDNYNASSRSSHPQDLEILLDQTYETTKAVADAVKGTNNLLDFYQDQITAHDFTVPTLVTTYQGSIDTYTGQTSSHLSSLLSIQSSIKNAKDTIRSSDRTITEKTESLAKLKSGADALDLESQQLTVQQRQNALLDAREKLADYFVRAPFDATIASLKIKKSDSVSSATVVATLVTKQQLAEISLNEVDIAKIKIGQKVNLTFDAIEGLGISGVVAEIDTVGAASQGVVSYGVKISFDTQDNRVKPGMSVSAVIVTDVKQDVVALPNGAIKANGDTQYVEILPGTFSDTEASTGIQSDTVLERRSIQTGLASDTTTEITSGLNAGDYVVARTTTATTQSTTQQAPSLFGSPGGNRAAGGGAVRTQR